MNEQGFTHSHNQFHVVQDTYLLGRCAFDCEASEFQGHPDHPPGRGLGGPAARPPAVSAATGTLTFTYPRPVSMIFFSYVKMHFSYIKSNILRKWLNMLRNYVHSRTFFTQKNHPPPITRPAT